MADLNVLGFAGSLRKGSLNRALLRAAQKLAPGGMAISIHDLDDVPLYNGDVEAAGDPPGVAAFKNAIRAADAVLMVTPEYNHGVPGVMKNAIDWASRPPRNAALSGKPVGIIGASAGMTGSARGQSQLRQAFEFTTLTACRSRKSSCIARTRNSTPPANSATKIRPSTWPLISKRSKFGHCALKLEPRIGPARRAP